MVVVERQILLPRREHVALAAVVLVFVGISGLFALGRPYFAATDESAHLGYVHALADFQLPAIDSAPPVPEQAAAWAVERATAGDVEHRTVWVANHPPLYHAALVPAIWLANATGRHDGGLIFMRFANIAAGSIGLVFTYLLARELAGVRRIAVAAAAFAGLVGLAPAVMSLGLTDGSAFAAGSFVLFAGARCIRQPIVRRQDLALLAVATTVAWGVRASTMLLAVATVLYVAVARAWSARGANGRLLAHRVAIVGLGPPMILVGWFYLRNIVIYGDIGASRFLLDRFERDTRGSTRGMLTEGQLWLRLVRGLTAPSTQHRGPLPGGLLLVAIGVCGFLVAASIGRTGDTHDDGRPGTIDGRVVGLIVAGTVVIAATVGQHLAGGGTVHSRYLLPVLGAIGAVLAAGFDRVVPRIGPAAAVAVTGWWSIQAIPTDADRAEEFRERVVEVSAHEPPASGSRQHRMAVAAGGDDRRRRHGRRHHTRRGHRPPGSDLRCPASGSNANRGGTRFRKYTTGVRADPGVSRVAGPDGQSMRRVRPPERVGGQDFGAPSS